MKRSETWDDDGPVRTGPEGEAPPTARELLTNLDITDYKVEVLAARVEKVLAVCEGDLSSYSPGYCFALQRVERILNGKSE
jgi:hypothetical protein